MCEKLQKVWNETTSIIFIEERSREERGEEPKPAKTHWYSLLLRLLVSQTDTAEEELSNIKKD